MAQSLLIACLTVGMNITLAIPDKYMIKDSYIKKGIEIAKANNLNFSIVNNPNEAAIDADIIITDVWASMGKEEEAEERIKAFQGYQVNTELMKFAKDDAIVLHCLPAHREEEITEEILELHANTIFEEAENRLHVQKAILVTLLK